MYLWWSWNSRISEPPHDKTNKVTVRPTQTQISLGIRTVWSESSLSAWRKLGSLATHWAHSEDSDQTGWMPRLIWVFAGRTCHFVGFVMRRLISCCNVAKLWKCKGAIKTEAITRIWNYQIRPTNNIRTSKWRTTGCYQKRISGNCVPIYRRYGPIQTTRDSCCIKPVRHSVFRSTACLVTKRIVNYQRVLFFTQRI